MTDITDTIFRFSHIRAFGRSAMHGLHAVQNEMKQTPAMQKGTAVDAMLYGTRKVVGCELVRNPKHAAYQEFMAANPDAEILTMADYDKACRMVEAIRASKTAEPWLKGVHQETLRFEYNGLQCRATPDTRGNGFLTELKTTHDGSPEKFRWHALRMAYHAQMWMQGVACQSHGFNIDRYMIVCVEANPPHPVTVYEWDATALEQGSRLLTLWTERLRVCMESKVYPPYSDAIVPLGIPDEMPELVYGDEE